MNNEGFMAMAISEMAKCRSLDGEGKPKVGAVVVRDNQVLALGHRGEIEQGQHAEFTVLDIKLKDQSVHGATVYTTLEPCTKRSPGKIPCADRLVNARVARVVIGQVDPNPSITGKGILRLREARIKVDFFTLELADNVECLNREYSQQQKREYAKKPLPVAIHATPTPYAIDGKTRLLLNNRLLDDWKPVAIVLEIPPHDRRRFRQGEEGIDLLDWLDARKRLGNLSHALRLIGRDDLADMLP